MRELLASKHREELPQDWAKHMTALTLLIAQNRGFLPEIVALEMIEFLRSLQALHAEMHTRWVVDFMSMGEQAKQFKDHSNQLLDFLLRLLEFNAEGSSEAVSLHAHRGREYLETWNQRQIPNDNELRQQFERLSAEASKQP